MPALETWCRVRVVNCCKRVLRSEDMHGAGAPDLAAVDRLARLALWAKRRGGRLVVSDLSPRLAELLHLTGLDAQAWGRAAGAGHSASGSGRSEVPI